MTRTAAQALAVARPVIRGLTLLNILYAAGITLLLVSSFFRPDWPWVPLGFDMHTAHPALPIGLRAIMVIGLVAIAIVHTILRRLMAIVDTVRGGNPFIAENARRLQAIAWSVLAITSVLPVSRLFRMGKQCARHLWLGYPSGSARSRWSSSRWPSPPSRG